MDSDLFCGERHVERYAHSVAGMGTGRPPLLAGRALPAVTLSPSRRKKSFRRVDAFALPTLAPWTCFSLLPRPWSTIAFTREGAATGQLRTCGVALLVYTSARWRALRHGTAWFRFEE
jgi:hypothetical protein